ncbi:MAG: type II secretion system F family protein [Candidatus Omnitrophota bacterium]
MPTYTYKAKKGPTEIIAGEIDAQTQDEATSRVIEMGLFPLSVAEKPGDLSVGGSTGERVSGLKDEPAHPLTRSPANLFTRIRQQDIDTFTHQLSSLVRASVPMLKGLSLIAEQTENRAMVKVVDDIKSQVKEGKMLSEAMKLRPDIFNNLYLNIVRAGERGGALDEVLSTLAKHREREQEIRQKVQAAMAYPALLTVVGFGTIFVMLTYFLPKLMKMFVDTKQALPLPTQILLVISKFMSANWAGILILLGLAAAVVFRVKPGSKKKLLFDGIKLRIPFINKFVKNSEIAKFARTLGLLLKNGISVTEGLELSASTLENEILKQKLSGVGKVIVNQGATMSSSLEKIDIFPVFAVNMIAVGEESGKLEESLNEVADVYEREVEQAIKIMTSLIEPLLILVIGAVVGFIVFAMLLPIFNMGMGSGR